MDRDTHNHREFLRQAAAAAIAEVGVTAGIVPLPLQESPRPGSPQAAVSGTIWELSNNAISAKWAVGNGIRLLSVTSRNAPPLANISGQALGAVFSLHRQFLKLDSTQMKIVGSPRVERVPAMPEAARLSERVQGTCIVAELVAPDGSLAVTWKALLRQDSHYVRQEMTLRAQGEDWPVDELRLLDIDLTGVTPNPSVAGKVKGSPVLVGAWFLAFEHPLADNRVSGPQVICGLFRKLPLRASSAVTYSSVVGVTTTDQTRRDFLRYVERERAHPYRTFLHYNSWYDLGYFTPYDEAAALDAIIAFGTELRQRRRVTLDSFLFDDGWDDHTSLWNFNSGFPRGFAPLAAAAARYGAAPGAWLSPWGGYGAPRSERLRYGAQEKFEINSQGFSLSGPIYYSRFRQVCLKMIHDYRINQFKIDGTGNASAVTPGSAFDSDFDAAIHLIGELRDAEPNLYINLTTGTYPSPFWLRYADSTWRGGGDDGFAGVGTDRQRWMTYRDAQTYQHVVQAGPLYPLNSLMLHGLIYARSAGKLATDPGNDFRQEIRAYFGNGTQLQEMYITHSLLSEANWNDLAEAARWSRRNAPILVDTHWVGGDPNELEPYGWAAWSAGRALLTLRNPSDKQTLIRLDPGEAWELPHEAHEVWTGRRPWRDEVSHPPITLRAGRTQSFDLEPFAVVTLEFTPA